MNYQSIKKLQKIYGADKIQDMINTGIIWNFEGTMGRYAMDLLRGGACMLPKHRTRDFYGNVIPSRYDVKPGTAGSYQNCLDYWEAVNAGDIDAVEQLEYI